MAALTATFVTKRLPVGDLAQVTFTCTTGAAAANEWVVTGLSTISAIIGAVVTGADPQLSTLNFVKNAQGTGVAEGTNHGDLGIESPTAETIEVTVLGRP